jgi:hypothetical protein
MMAALPHLTPLDIFGRDKNMEIIRHIKGWPVTVDYVLDEITFMKSGANDDDIKFKLCQSLAVELFKDGMIEFTKEKKVDTGDIHYRARIFAVPNTEVQFLRVQEIIK